MSKVSLRKRGSTWEYRFQISSSNGKQHYASKGGFATKKEAALAGSNAQQEYHSHGIIPTSGEITYSDYLDFWLKSYCQTNLKDTTYQSYVKRIEFLLKPNLRDYKLKQLTPLSFRISSMTCSIRDTAETPWLRSRDCFPALWGMPFFPPDCLLKILPL